MSLAKIRKEKKLGFTDLYLTGLFQQIYVASYDLLMTDHISQSHEKLRFCESDIVNLLYAKNVHKSSELLAQY